MSTRELPRSPTDLVAGMLVGEFVIEAKIGEGGFGAVYKATHPLIGKLVAIKVLAQHFSAQEEMVSRFVAEARAVNQIRNRNIIDIFSFGTLPDGRVYYVMEFLDGESLEAYASRVGPMPLVEVIAIVAPIARALDAAHAVGIAHRDIKPENILLVRDEGQVFPKLLDFGIAKLLGNETAMHKTQTGAPIGTPDYMSPEQCRGRDVDHRTDFYSFGVMLYRLLTGRVPFDGEDYLTILMKHISEPVPSLRASRPDLPAAVQDVVEWLLRKAAVDRPDSLRIAIERLASVSQNDRASRGLSAPMALGETLAASAVYLAPSNSLTSSERPGSSGWFGRPALIALAAVGVVLIVAVVAWRLWSPSATPARRSLDPVVPTATSVRPAVVAPSGAEPPSQAAPSPAVVPGGGAGASGGGQEAPTSTSNSASPSSAETANHAVPGKRKARPTPTVEAAPSGKPKATVPTADSIEDAFSN